MNHLTNNMPYQAICPCQIKPLKAKITQPHLNSKNYQNCCAPLHDDENTLIAADIEKIMRSRYTAFVFKKIDYLVKTTYFSGEASHQAQLAQNLRDSLIEDFNTDNANHTIWQGLMVLDVNAQMQQVEFKAYYKINGHMMRIHEKSQFIKINHLNYFQYNQDASIIL